MRDAAVQRHARARFDAHHAADGNLFYGLHLPCTSGVLHFSLWRAEVEQAADSIARAVHRTRFDGFGDGVERHHHGGLWPLAYEESARDRYRHQCVDVQLELAQGGQAFLIGRKARQGDGNQR